MKIIQQIHLLESIEALQDLLIPNVSDDLRTHLLSEFDKLVNYQNIKEWNQLVRVCESLTIIGWGDREALEATAEKSHSLDKLRELPKIITAAGR